MLKSYERFIEPILRAKVFYIPFIFFLNTAVKILKFFKFLKMRRIYGRTYTLLLKIHGINKNSWSL